MSRIECTRSHHVHTPNACKVRWKVQPCLKNQTRERHVKKSGGGRQTRWQTIKATEGFTVGTPGHRLRTVSCGFYMWHSAFCRWGATGKSPENYPLIKGLFCGTCLAVVARTQRVLWDYSLQPLKYRISLVAKTWCLRLGRCLHSGSCLCSTLALQGGTPQEPGFSWHISSFFRPVCLMLRSLRASHLCDCPSCC